MTQIGSHVEFDDEDGNTLSGTVFHFLPCLTNGRKHAVVEIDSHLPGITHTVPLDNLRPIPRKPICAYASGDPDPLKHLQGSRFFVLP